MCDDECESVSHVFLGFFGLQYSKEGLYASCRSFLRIDEHFESLDSFEKAPFVLDSEVWEDDFSSMLDLIKDYIVDVWESRKAL